MIDKITLAHCWLAMKDRSSSKTAVRVPRISGSRDITWGEYHTEVEKIAAGLLSLGIQKGDRIALMSNTRYEWGCADLAILSIGAVTVPVYHNNTPDECEFLMNDSEACVFIAENRTILRQWRKIADKCKCVRHVICFETDDPANPALISWEGLKHMGTEFLATKPDAVEKRAQAMKPDDLATILYTSGTTGLPKGVVIAHEQAISEVSEAFPLCGVTENDLSLAFLPAAHIFGRIELWGHLWIGFTIAYAESIEKIRHDLVEIKPTIMIAVPRIFEKVYAAILSQMEGNVLQRRLFEWAVKVGQEVSERRLTRQFVPLGLLAQHEIAKRLVLQKVKDAFGGNLRFAVSGGAPLNRDISMFFHSAGILILEGYGLSETTAAITVNTPFNYKFGSVGRPIGDVQLKMADDGEILVKSKKVMREYYKNPEATKAAIVDGWFRTGDIGEILPGGDLRITDRKKDLIKTAGGKYVAPQRLEGLLQMNPVISHALIHGDQKKFIVALLTVDRAFVENYASENDITYGKWTDLLEKPQVQQLVRKAVSDTNSVLASWESIKRFSVLPNEFSVEGGELTPSLKVKRKALDRRFRESLEALYN